MSGNRVTRARTAATAADMSTPSPSQMIAGGQSGMSISSGSNTTPSSGSRRRRRYRGSGEPHGPGTRATTVANPSPPSSSSSSFSAVQDIDIVPHSSSSSSSSSPSASMRGNSRANRRTKQHIPFPGPSYQDSMDSNGNKNMTSDSVDSGDARERDEKEIESSLHELRGLLKELQETNWIFNQNNYA